LVLSLNSGTGTIKIRRVTKWRCPTVSLSRFLAWPHCFPLQHLPHPHRRKVVGQFLSSNITPLKTKTSLSARAGDTSERDHFGDATTGTVQCDPGGHGAGTDFNLWRTVSISATRRDLMCQQCRRRSVPKSETAKATGSPVDCAGAFLGERWRKKSGPDLSQLGCTITGLALFAADRLRE
jgi:hypothetical protein